MPDNQSAEIEKLLGWLRNMAYGWDTDNGGDGSETDKEFEKARTALLALSESRAIAELENIQMLIADPGFTDRHLGEYLAERMKELKERK